MKRSLFVILVVAAMFVTFVGSLMAAPMILNEYNAVKADSFLKDGKSDTYFGIVQGNGGSWAEFVVTENNLDIRGWSFMSFVDNALASTVNIANDDAYASLAKGTIFTISATVESAVSSDGWWVNYNDSSFVTANKNCQLLIMNADSETVFGLAGEGISPTSGVGGDEVFKFEGAPSASVLETDVRYTDGSTSTFGSPNVFTTDGVPDVQDFSEVPEPSTLVALLGGLGGLLAARRRFTK